MQFPHFRHRLCRFEWYIVRNAIDGSAVERDSPMAWKITPHLARRLDARGLARLREILAARRVETDAIPERLIRDVNAYQLEERREDVRR